jgi:hypothetical protein
MDEAMLRVVRPSTTTGMTTAIPRLGLVHLTDRLWGEDSTISRATVGVAQGVVPNGTHPCRQRGLYITDSDGYLAALDQPDSGDRNRIE